MPLEPLLIACALLPALAMAPWRTLRASGLQNPWLASRRLLPVRCATRRALPGGLVLPMSGACLMVLMFGWPLAVLSLALIAITGAWIAGDILAHAVNAPAWNGVLPATLALGLGLATRRWLAQHVFVCILGRGCSVTAVAIVVAGALSARCRRAVGVIAAAARHRAGTAVARPLAEGLRAFVTGMSTATFVGFRPAWLASGPGRRDLPRE